MPATLRIALHMLVTLLPVIIAGIEVMIFVKLPLLDQLKHPIDNNLVLADGQRLFGDHKTWKGFLGYILFTSIWTLLLGLLCSYFPTWEAMNYLYVYQENTPLYNLLIGAALGFGYAVFELPNSFLKRRLAIRPGQTAQSRWRYLLIFLDQADSVIACVIVLAFVYPMSIRFFISYVLLGAAVHLFLNLALALAGLRKEKR